MIRYYSAPRRASGVTLVTDVAFVAAFLLAVPATFICSWSVTRTGTITTVNGRLFEPPSGPIVGAMDRADRLASGWPEGTLLGTFTIQMIEAKHGFPTTTRTGLRSFRLDLDVFDEAAPRTGVVLAPDDPFRTAIDAVLLEEDVPEVREAFENNGLGSRQVLSGWIAGSILWLFLLMVLLVTGSRLGWYAWAVLHQGRRARASNLRASGHCVECGYDLRGTEYSERCPECGAMAY